jgi:glycosyltransferase involved in cell wall biosynthesis
MKIIVIQSGARHRYAVPRILHEAGCLESLYTDSNGSYGIGRLLSCLPGWLLPAPARRLSGRKVLGLHSDRVRCTDITLPFAPLLSFGWPWFKSDLLRDRLFSCALKRWGFGQASMVYSMFGEGWPFIESAKQHGLKVALEIFINPITHRILERERRRFPDWELPDDSDFEAMEIEIDKRIAVADFLLCPSTSVVDGLKCYPSFQEKKTRVVPYGHAIDVTWQQCQPIPGRVLFGGSATLRKGIHYFARAAEVLSRKAAGYDFRVAGSASQSVRERPECQCLTFLGPLPRSEFLTELRAAHVFALPTLAEGSASVIYEALASGVPVVATASAGSVITDGKEGRIVPECDAAALADAISEIVSDGRLRTQMSLAALHTAEEFSEAKWAARLIHALQDNARTDTGYAPF